MNDTSSDLKIFLQDPDPWSGSVLSAKIPSILPPGSARYCTQTLSTLEPGETFCPPGSSVLKTYALNTSPYAFKKYTSIIECSDHYPPAYLELWPQRSLWIYSTVRMMVWCENDVPLLLRHPPVPESMIFHDSAGREELLENSLWNHGDRSLVSTRSGFISYAPILKMQVQKLTLMSKEWEPFGTWSLELLEI